MALVGLTVAWRMSAAGAETFHRVAYDDAGATDCQPHLIESDGDWRFDNPGTDSEALRTCSFGARVVFAYAGLKPQAKYKARLRFFSDGAREFRVKAGDTVLLPSVKLEAGKITEHEADLPATVTLMLTFEKIEGPNAVVSEVEILSTDPTFLTALPAPAVAVPRLSPRPAAVAGVAQPILDLAGTWTFRPDPAEAALSAPIQVPGEWVMQGFEVKAEQAAAYEREFSIPADWAGKLIKLRCDAVFSDATVFLNGTLAGRHLGGFTPFELDVTDLVRAGEPNVVKLAVISDSVADKLASASRYACHALGGITRGIRLFAVPAVHVSSLFVFTRFDPDCRDATLELDLGVEGDAKALLTFTGPDGKEVPLTPNRVAPGRASIPVSQPKKWDPEHPNLYTLTVRLEHGGKVVETVTQRVGFRQIEVRGNELFVNNLPVKIRGINHHEVYPTTGRTPPPGIHRRDVELFREGNVNLLRTCHYPPDEALMQAADELGMFIECEAPFCWAPGDGHKAYVCQATAEMVLAFRNHPSVLWWSLANESKWGPHFVASSKLARRLDPTRPQIFNDIGSKSDPKYTDLINFHYPGRRGPAAARKGQPQPVYLGEDCHLNAYNRLELATDPMLRDIWGRYTRELWDDIYNTKGCLGQSIWSGVDDTFYIGDDQTVGYGTWGPIDGWRREKPEYWNMKKAYSPVRLGQPRVDGNTITLPIENRAHFSNLSEYKIKWRLDHEPGTVAADIAPGGKGELVIKPRTKVGKAGTLRLQFTDPRGFVADEFAFALAAPPAAPAAVSSRAASPAVVAQTGLFVGPVAGPKLMLLPLNKDGETQMTGKTKVWTPFTAPCSGWTCGAISTNGNVVKVQGKYDNAEGSFTYTFQTNGMIEIEYAFRVTHPVNPRQVGLVFTLPRDCEAFSWEREGYWNVYPEDHIARLKGSVKASEGFEATSVGPRTEPAHPWRLDNLPYGNNDFCSTKHNVLRATVLDKAGRGLTIDGRGRQHVRCWRDEAGVHVLVADYSNGGSERFLRGFAEKDDRPLKPGAVVEGTVCLRLPKGGGS